MRHFLKRFSILMTVFLLIPVLSIPASANIGENEWPEKITFYLQGSHINYFDLTELTGNLNHKKVKSSRPSVAKIDTVAQFEYSDYYKGSLYSGSRTDGRIFLELFKAGTTTVSFVAGSEKGTTKVTVKDYVNPIKTLTVPGLNGGKNMASIFRKKSTRHLMNLPSKKNKKTGNIKAVAKDGWKITSLSFGESPYERSYVSSGVRSCSVRLPYPINVMSHDYIRITAVNIKNGGTISLVCELGDGN